MCKARKFKTILLNGEYQTFKRDREVLTIKQQKRYEKRIRKQQEYVTSFYMKKGNVNSINTANYVPTYLIDRKHKQVWDYHKPVKLQKLEII